MARALPFRIEGVCIDCAAPFRRDMGSWRCWGCERAMAAIRARAMAAVHLAVASGAIPKAAMLPCIDCEEPASVYDHRDYRQPLNVVPVCRKCNQRRGPAAWADYVEGEA